MTKGFPYYTGGGGGGDGLAEIICTVAGAFAGACAALMSTLPILSNSPLPLRFAAGGAIGAALGWVICHLILSSDVRKETAINVRAVSTYPGWIVMLFPISLVAVLIGFASILYMWLFGFSIIGLAGAYLVALGM